MPGKRVRTYAAAFALSLAIFTSVQTAHPAFAQSLDVHNPAKLQEGPNKAVIDSFGGDHFWFFTAQPGNFTLTFKHSDAQEGFNVGPKPSCGAIINPAVQGSKMTFKEGPGGVVYTGHCDRPTRILIAVEPAKSPLVRQTTDYMLVVNGSGEGGSSGGGVVSGPGGGIAILNAMGGGSGSSTSSGSADVVTGVYDVNQQGLGSAKFSADGSIVTTMGQRGTWQLFDASTRTYIVKIGDSVNWNLTFQPARGFVDKNGMLMLTMKQQVR